MKLQARPYRDTTDLARMRHLLVVGSQANIPASYIHPGCLDWAAHYPPDEQQRRRNIRLWERVGIEPPMLEAWAIFLPNERTFDLFVSPALYGTPTHEGVMDAYVAWAAARAREGGLTQLSPFWVFDDDTEMERLMRAHGFVVVQADPPPPLFERSLDDLPTIPLPRGFTVQGVRNLEDGRLRAAVTHAAFRPNDDWDTYWAEYQQFIESVIYRGEDDVFVRAPGGQGASACTIWCDAANAVGLFEPVATHPDFQGKGLGKIVMAEGMRRMKAAGMQRAIVGFDPNNTAARALYTSLGFQASRYFAVYCKEI